MLKFRLKAIRQLCLLVFMFIGMMVLLGVSVSAAGPIDPGSLPTPEANNDTIRKILTVVNTIIGALALLIITVSGLRYITSAGDPQKAANAKNGVIYALVGIAIALISQSIVVFVVRNL